MAWAHCDSLDGPVVVAARKALASGDVNLLLIWVRPADETAVRQAFTRTLSVRKLTPEAKELAETWFFETVVRLHRAGEGAPYTGLKPAGQDFGPAIAGAEKAIETGSAEALAKMLTTAAREGLEQRFHKLMEARTYQPSDLAAGRRYVAAFVDFLHFADRLHTAIAPGAEAAEKHEH
ncbi:MAG: hypothetical protein HZB13_09215 [Acidobacteria bacterium]|nr:hypothetical protein [Acidobacteriota bacterium]